MNDLKIFFLEIAAFTRKTSRSPESILSSISITLVVFALTILVFLAAPVFMTDELALLFIYGLAIFEVLFGLRVGFLRIGANSNEQYLSVPSRFWKRSFPYLFPALFIPIPISIAVTNFLATSTASWYLILATAVTSYMMFFFLGIAWSMIIRSISKRAIPRIIILLISVITLFSLASSGDFIFRTMLINQSYGDYAQLFVIIAQLSTATFFILLIDLILKGLPLTTEKFGKFWPIFLVGRSHSYGQGSNTFFTANKMFLRSTAFHRRISALILSLLMFLLILYAVLFVGGSQINGSIILTIILLFTAVSSLLISMPSAQLAHNTIKNLNHLPLEKNKILTGSWLAGLAWQIGAAVLFFGIISTWVIINPAVLILVIIGASTQHILFFGWTKKLNEAIHHNLSLFAVFSLAILVGILPVLLLPVSGITQTVLIQLIWLGFIGILLHTTTHEEIGKYA